MAKYTAEFIAHWFIWRNRVSEDTEGGDPLSILSLMKLMYYAESAALATNRGSLFPDPIVAWMYGPAVKKIWTMYAGVDKNKLTISDEDLPELKSIAREDADLLEDVFLTFGQYSAWGLREMVRRETPWLEVAKGDLPQSQEISRESMAKYFAEHHL